MGARRRGLGFHELATRTLGLLWISLWALSLAASARSQALAQTAQSAKAAPVASANPPQANPPRASSPQASSPQANSPQANPSQSPTSKSDTEEDEDTTPTVVVRAKKIKPPGSVVGDIEPEQVFNPSEIQSFGVSTVTELLEELAPESRSDRGRGGEAPVVLLNGRRISSLNEIQNIPTEAILRVDILPEEVSLKYGYTADQRVINIVLRRRFRAITGELDGGETTEGGHETGEAEVDLLHLRGDARLNLDLKYQPTSNLTEKDRGIEAEGSGPAYAVGGNVVSPVTGGQVDPALSALVGRPVTIAGVPVGASSPLTLADFEPTAGVPNVTPIGADRTLLPATQNLTANAVLAGPTFWGLNATVNATLAATSSASLQGLPGVDELVPAGDPFSPFGSEVSVLRYVDQPLRQNIDGWTAHVGSTLNKDLGDWRLSFTNAYDHSDSQTVSDTGFSAGPAQALLNAGSLSFNPFGSLSPGLFQALPQGSARAISDSANIQFLANGPVVKLPTGDFYASAKIGDTESVQASHAELVGLIQSTNLARNDANAQLNLDLPVASASHHSLPWVGELALNLNVAVDQVSDFGVLPTLGYGVNWTPITGVNLIVSTTHDHLAPTPAQLAGPEILTPGVRVFDYATGQTVSVTQITGGQNKLLADSRNVMKVGLTLKPWVGRDFTVTANYIDSRLKNAIATFPAATAAIEAAYPDRFIRNSQGELTEEDDRPVNFAEENRQELRWGFNYSTPIGPQPPPRAPGRFRPPADAAQRARAAAGSSAPNEQAANGQTPGGAASAEGGGPPPGGGGRPRGGGGGGGGRFGPGSNPGGGRLQVALYHTLYFRDQILVRPGGPVLDLLNGAPAGGAGGQYVQEIEGQLGFTLMGFGARISADWRSGTYVQGAGGSTGNLNFSDLGTINLRLFDNLGQQRSVLQRYPWLRGARVTFNVINLFDQRIQVHDSSGATPLIYQPAFLNPAGRSFTLSFRKLFY